jgi:hypothetical protein
MEKPRLRLRSGRRNHAGARTICPESQLERQYVDSGGRAECSAVRRRHRTRFRVGLPLPNQSERGSYWAGKRCRRRSFLEGAARENRQEMTGRCAFASNGGFV